MYKSHNIVLYVFAVFLLFFKANYVAALGQCVHCYEDIQNEAERSQCRDCNGSIHIHCHVTHCPVSYSDQLQLGYNTAGQIVAVSAGVSIVVLIAQQLFTSTTSSIQGAGNIIGGAIDHTANHLGHNVGDRIEQAGSEIANSITTTGRNAGWAVAFAMIVSSMLSALKRVR